ncbi:MAG: sulfatase-like hydrolase/transferase [Opitutaceae bacterium]|nr:sulfatase-like hydrolase/transferase [Cephaloticoccus sp.]MCP5529272.1 sulfatase-like hydrolase/transferase [Opitutaceae bacterium]
MPEPARSDPTRAPNILLILMDDMGWGDLRCHGNAIADTPNLDALAASGLEAEQFCVSPVCSPTRASVLTGRYYPRTGVSLTGRGYETIRAEEVTLADMLAAQGYATGCFGKWHNGSYYPYTADGRGFQEFAGFNAGYINHYFDVTLESTSGPQETEGYLVDVLADQAQDFIFRHRDEPWFCLLPFNVPHLPFQAPDGLYEKYRARGCHAALAAVYAMNESADQAVGRVLAHLARLGLADNTVVTFMSDHGPNTPRYNAGLRGIKGCLHEGGVRVPFFVRWPGHIPAGSRLTQPAADIDLVPTLLGLAGLAPPPEVTLDGVNLAESWCSGGATPGPERLLFGYFENTGTVRTPTHRLLIPADARAELYDLAHDPGETMNLLAGQGQNPADLALAQELRTAYETWAQDVGAGKTDRPAIPVGHRQAPVVDVRSLDVDGMTGSLRLGRGWGSQNWLTNWTDPDATMSWRLDVVEADDYDFALRYTCVPGDEGSTLQLEVGEQRLVVELAESFVPEVSDLPDRVKPRPGPPEQTWGTVEMGRLPLPVGETRMTLRVLAMPGKAVADVWAVRITRNSAPVAP